MISFEVEHQTNPSQIGFEVVACPGRHHQIVWSNERNPMSRAESKLAEMKVELAAVLAPQEIIVMWGGCTAKVDRLGMTVTRRGTAFVSDKRFGILTKKIGGQDLVDIPLALISTVELDRNITAAQLIVVGAGVTVRLERMVVGESKMFARAIREQMAKAHTQVEIVPSIPGSSTSIVDQISKLTDLHKQGLLTAEEFSVAESKILDQP